MPSVLMCNIDFSAVNLVNKSCLPQWSVASNNFQDDGSYTFHSSAKTAQQCQYACVFNPQCVGVLWPQCFMYTELTGNGFPIPRGNYTMFKLVERCSTTPGSLFSCSGYIFSPRDLCVVAAKFALSENFRRSVFLGGSGDFKTHTFYSKRKQRRLLFLLILKPF